MIVYVGAGGGKLRELIIAAGHGQITSRQKSAFRVPRFGRWVFDNGAFTDWKNKKRFDDAEFLKRVRRIESLSLDRTPDWCVCPDMVGKRVSLIYSLEWRAFLQAYAPGLKWYLAVQDYMRPEDVEYALGLERFHGLFIGGSFDWKWETAAGWVELGHNHGIPVHLARVNGQRRLQMAVDLGADSVDGTGWVRAGFKWLPYLQDMPKPQRLLLEEDKEIPKKWKGFAAFLTEIWPTPEVYEQGPFLLDEAEDDWERYDRIAAMSLEEFVEWYTRLYNMKSVGHIPEFDSMMDFQEWKLAVVDEAERFLGRVIVPPAPMAVDA